MVRPIGVLGLQGDFDAHRTALSEVGVESIVVRWPRQLEEVDGLIIPGGESTTLRKLMEAVGFEESIRRFHSGGGALFGTCAGAILLARHVTDPEQASLGLIDITIRRNAYGRQRESFESAGGDVEREAADALGAGPVPLILIRAPRITSCGTGVAVLIRHQGEPVLVRQRNVLAGTFHPELAAERAVQRYFVDMVCETGVSSQVPHGSLS